MTDMYNELGNDEVPGNWKRGIITLIRKNGDRGNIKNYRPITLLNTIYKIRATIITRTLKRCMDFLTCETHHVYKIKINRRYNLAHKRK